MLPTQRKIIHIDCDCFYASIEMRDNPALVGKPVAVGGAADRRGVIATCNYEARRFGVHSAMPTGRALTLCPTLILIPPHFDKYREASRQIRTIYEAFTDRIEPLSLDEAFLDVSNSPHCQGSATRIALAIRDRIREEVGITASAGIAPNKFIAKIASGWNKPDGQYVVRPEQVDDFVRDLPVGKLFGVGKVTEAKMNALGLFTCADLRGTTPAELSRHFGRFGERLWQLAHGHDERPVDSDGRRKSLSVEITFNQDLPDASACIGHLPALFEDMSQRLAKVDRSYRVTKAYFKMKFADFSQTTMERSIAGPDLDTYQYLCRECFARGEKPVRLLGIGVRFVDEADNPQPSLF